MMNSQLLPPPRSSDENSQMLNLYEIVFDSLRHEGNGIWERFNILVGINLALFAGLGLVCLGQSRPTSWRCFGIVISLGGIGIGVWSCCVLRRLWDRHAYWRKCLEKIQKQFPSGWTRPIDQEDQSQLKWFKLNLTTPYLVVFLLAWVLILVTLLVNPGAFEALAKAG